MLLLFLLSCAVSHGVRPIGEGNHAVEASLGGPVVRLYDKPVPIPLSSVGWRYGLHDRSDLHMRLQPTTALLFGVVAGDVGASWMLVDQEGWRPAVVTEGSLYGALGKGVFRGYGELEALGSWKLGERGHLAYVGADVFVQPRAWVEDNPYLPLRSVLAGPLVGARFMLGEHTGLAAQLTWFEPWTDTEALTAYYYSPGQQGAIQIELGFHRTFGR
ncbi:MAG TPA: hypothetical protein QGF58_02260 [Myxococcota bacterium]|nr:hypothetical protein [Myxococcota bacterium]